MGEQEDEPTVGLDDIDIGLDDNGASDFHTAENNLEGCGKEVPGVISKVKDKGKEVVVEEDDFCVELNEDSDDSAYGTHFEGDDEFMLNDNFDGIDEEEVNGNNGDEGVEIGGIAEEGVNADNGDERHEVGETNVADPPSAEASVTKGIDYLLFHFTYFYMY